MTSPSTSRPSHETPTSGAARSSSEPRAVTGVQLAKGIGVRPARGFWVEAWSSVFKKRTAVLALAWLSVIAFFAVYAPVLASGHPMWMSVSLPGGGSKLVFPLWQHLEALDIVLLVWVTLGVPAIFLAREGERGRRAQAFIGGLLLAIAILALCGIVKGRLDEFAQNQSRELSTRAVRTGENVASIESFVSRPGAGYIVGGAVAITCGAIAMAVGGGRRKRRLLVCLLAMALAMWAVASRWKPPLARFNYDQRAQLGEVSPTYTLVRWSPFQRFSDMSRKEPGSSRWRAAIDVATRPLPLGVSLTPEQIRGVAEPVGSAVADAPEAMRARAMAALENAATTSGVDRDRLRRLIDDPLAPKFHLGTDRDGADVLTQVLHACRISISIGLVSTGVALLIGVSMGALMGYFRGWVDLILYRVVEIFMAVPVLFLLIVAVAVLPDELKTTYVIMGIIGCFTWTGMARYTRAEFLKLRNQDFVQSAQATGLPLRSILFKHMLPNGVAPVLVDTSFSIAAAIGLEATLSYLGLGPTDSASWGKLLSSAISSEGEFKWWLAVFPGAAIFLTVLSYNLLGESLRDAIDPKLKKARV